MDTSIDIIYCYRNRDLQRVKNSLDSLALQSSKNFNVIFVDYGSDDGIANQIKPLCEKYSFCSYVYIDSQGKMWNRAEALNYGFYISKAEYVFTSDIDMVFDTNFIKTISSDLESTTAKFYSVGYLSENDTQQLNVNDFSKLKYTKSENFALGMVLLSKKMVVHINGYNSFYAIWGQEDNDIKYRIEKAGFSTKFVNEKTHMLHQYHPVSNSDSSTIPDGWLQYIKDYHENYKLEEKSFPGLDAIKIPVERPAKNVYLESGVVRRLNYRKLFIRHELINSVFKIGSGNHLSYHFDVNKNIMAKSGIYKLSKFINNFFRVVKIPLEVKSKYREQYIDKNEIRNEIFFVLKSLEAFIKDYYINMSDDSIKLVIVRK